MTAVSRLLPVLLAASLLTPLAAAPASPEALAEARALFEARKDPEARLAYEALAKQDPANPEPLRCLGYLALRRDDPDAAVACFEKAIVLAPEHAETHRALGDGLGRKVQKAGVLSKFGLAKKCLAAYERAVALDANSVGAHESLFGYYLNAPAIAGGDRGKALREAEALKRLDPARRALALARAHPAAKEYADALAELEISLQKTPDDFYINYQVGKLCDTAGIAPERGLAALRHCLDLPPLTPPDAPKHQHAYWRIGNILKAQGDLAGARAAYEAALKVDANFEHAAKALKELPASVAPAR
jgi:tetratricopeptide (TPR) repeat protein